MKIADITKPSGRLKGKACKFLLGSALFLSASLMSGQAAAYADYFGIIGLTTDPAEFAQYVSPSETVDFTTWTPGNYGGSQVLSGNGFSVTASSASLTYNPNDVNSASFSPSSSLTVVNPGRLSTQDPGTAVLFTSNSGNPSGMGGMMRLLDASGQTTSGSAVLTIEVAVASDPSHPQSISFPLAFDATNGWAFGSVIPGLPSSFFFGGFWGQAAYLQNPDIYYAGFAITPGTLATTGQDSSALFAAVDIASAGASKLFNGVPEIDALAGTSALSLIGFATVLTAERRRRKV